MSDSVRPRRQQPTRLCCPWDSPGKNTGVGCHLFRMWDSVMWGTFTVLGNNRYHPVILKITATPTTPLSQSSSPRHLATTFSLQLFPLGYFYISASFLKISSLFIFVILSTTSLGLFIPGFFFSLNLLIMAVLKGFLLITTSGDIQRQFILTDFFLCVFHYFFLLKTGHLGKYIITLDSYFSPEGHCF